MSRRLRKSRNASFYLFTRKTSILFSFPLGMHFQEPLSQYTRFYSLGPIKFHEDICYLGFSLNKSDYPERFPNPNKYLETSYKIVGLSFFRIGELCLTAYQIKAEHGDFSKNFTHFLKVLSLKHLYIATPGYSNHSCQNLAFKKLFFTKFRMNRSEAQQHHRSTIFGLSMVVNFAVL